MQEGRRVASRMEGKKVRDQGTQAIVIDQGGI
jgi:hypothetical protein